MKVPDETLVSRCRQGDMAAFEQLVLKYQDRVYNLAYKLTGSPDDAVDMSQEAFLRVYQSLTGFRGQSSFSTWLYRIVSNVCMDELRRRNRRPLLTLDRRIQTDEGDMAREIPDTGPGPEEYAEQNELSRELSGVLTELDHHHRLIIVLRDIEELSYQEIGEILRMPLGTVKSRLNRARHALRNLLSKRELLGGDVRQLG